MGTAQAACQHNKDETKAPAVEGWAREKSKRRKILGTHEIKGGRNDFEYDLSVVQHMIDTQAVSFSDVM